MERERRKIWKVSVYKPREKAWCKRSSTNYIPVKQTVCFHRRVYSDYTGSTLREDGQPPVLARPVPLLSLRAMLQAQLGTQKSLLNDYIKAHCLPDPESSSSHK